MSRQTETRPLKVWVIPVGQTVTVQWTSTEFLWVWGIAFDGLGLGWVTFPRLKVAGLPVPLGVPECRDGYLNHETFVAKPAATTFNLDGMRHLIGPNMTVEVAIVNQGPFPAVLNGTLIVDVIEGEALQHLQAIETETPFLLEEPMDKSSLPNHETMYALKRRMDEAVEAYMVASKKTLAAIEKGDIEGAHAAAAEMEGPMNEMLGVNLEVTTITMKALQTRVDELGAQANQTKLDVQA